jgi:hypothetical protein
MRNIKSILPIPKGQAIDDTPGGWPGERAAGGVRRAECMSRSKKTLARGGVLC